MTTQQLYLFGCLYLVILAVVAVLTRATLRRIAGALVGGAVAGVALLGIVAIGENAGWWHMAITWEPYFLTVMCIGTIPCGFIFLITWRMARRFVAHRTLELAGSFAFWTVQGKLEKPPVPAEGLPNLMFRTIQGYT